MELSRLCWSGGGGVSYTHLPGPSWKYNKIKEQSIILNNQLIEEESYNQGITENSF